MYIYLLYFLRLYPFLFYVLRVYQLYEYINYAQKIYKILSITLLKLFPKKKPKEIDEIYEFVLETEPYGEPKTIIKDDTKYIKYNEENKEIKKNYFE
jgi:hypothetical protein